MRLGVGRFVKCLRHLFAALHILHVAVLLENTCCVRELWTYNHHAVAQEWDFDRGGDARWRWCVFPSQTRITPCRAALWRVASMQSRIRTRADRGCKSLAKGQTDLCSLVDMRKCTLQPSALQITHLWYNSAALNYQSGVKVSFTRGDQSAMTCPSA